jgi:hypothetical protein
MKSIPNIDPLQYIGTNNPIIIEKPKIRLRLSNCPGIAANISNIVAIAPENRGENL